jgi:hypothetical protein
MRNTGVSKYVMKKRSTVHTMYPDLLLLLCYKWSVALMFSDAVSGPISTYQHFVSYKSTTMYSVALRAHTLIIG